jgi:hypothetical protein
MIFCALALLAAATCAAVLCAVPVLLTEVVAMGFYQGCASGFDTKTPNLNDQLM